MLWWSTRNSLRLCRGVADVGRRGISGFWQCVRRWQSSRWSSPCYELEQTLNLCCFYSRNRFSCLSAVPAVSLLLQGSILTAICHTENLLGPSSKMNAYGIFLVRLFVVFTRSPLKAEIIALKD